MSTRWLDTAWNGPHHMNAKCVFMSSTIRRISKIEQLKLAFIKAHFENIQENDLAFGQIFFDELDFEKYDYHLARPLFKSQIFVEYT